MTHVPVLAAEAVAALVPRDGGLYVDATFGGGGYSRVCSWRRPAAAWWRIDRDPDAVARGAGCWPDASPASASSPRRFGDMAQALRALGIDGVDGIVLDLGVSSFQLDTAERGFSFRAPGPLDMRMDREGPSAADLLADARRGRAGTASCAPTATSRDARRIARAIVADRGSAVHHDRRAGRPGGAGEGRARRPAIRRP